MEASSDSPLFWSGQLLLTIGRSGQCSPRTTTTTSTSTPLTSSVVLNRTLDSMAVDEFAQNAAESNQDGGSYLDYVPIYPMLLVISSLTVAVVFSMLIVRRALAKNGAIPYQIPHFCVWASKIVPFVRYKDTPIHMTFLPSLKAAEHMEVKEDDIYVASFPRSGTTWTQELVYLVANNADVDKARATYLSDRFPYLEAPFTGLYKVARLPSPRLVKTHLPYHLLPKQIHQKNSKIIYVMRNFKDVIVSNYNFFKTLSLPYGGTFDDFCQLFFENKYVFSPWWGHVKGFWDNRQKSNILILKYEEMQQDIEGTVKKLSEFLEKPLTEEQVQRIVNHCSFDSMKKNTKVNHKWWDDLRFTQNNDFIRKGKVGDWKNYFSEKQSAMADEMVRQHLGDTGLAFQDVL